MNRVHSGPEWASIPVAAEGESACQMDAGLSVNGICLSGDRASIDAASRWYQEACQIETYWRPEVIRLTTSIKNANANHEKFERLWYLAKDDVDRLKLAICGGEDVPGAINAVTVEDCERFIREERGRHLEAEARLSAAGVGFDGGGLTLGALERARADYDSGFKDGRAEEFRTAQTEYDFKAEDEWFEHVLSDGE